MQIWFSIPIVFFGTSLFSQSSMEKSNSFLFEYNTLEFGVSELCGFQVNNELFSGVSTPIQFQIRQGVVSKGISNPITFTINHQISNIIPESNTPQVPFDMEENLVEETIVREKPKYIALVIGINQYKHANAQLSHLNNAIPDAERLYRVLVDTYQFSKEHSVMLENPTRQQIIYEFEKMADLVSPKDNLLVFYAGHGVWDERIKVGYWLPSDAKTTDKSGWISNSTVRDYLAGINSRHSLLITDACFSGSIFKTREAHLSEIAMANLYKRPSRKAMTSGTLTSVPDDSKFMHFLMKRLIESDAKYLSARQLFFSIETAILNNSFTVPQFGVIQDTGDEGGDFIFIRKE
jgi:hypothetical protein